MKVKNLIKLSIMLVVILRGVLLGGNKVLAVRDRNMVILLQDDRAKSTVHVYLGMTEEASIASFQIGLKLDTEADAKFTLNSKLNKDNLEYTYNKEKGTLNIYYAGSQELNPAGDDKVEIGTISFDVDKTKDVSIKVTPVDELVTASSIGHSETEIEVKPEDELFAVIAKTSSGGSSSGSGSSGSQGGETSGGNQGENPGGGNNPSGGDVNPGGGQGGENPTPGNPNSPNNPNGGSGSGSQGESGNAGDNENPEENQAVPGDENTIVDENKGSQNTNTSGNKNQNNSEYNGNLPKTGDSYIGEILLGLALSLVLVPLAIIIYRKFKKLKFKF